VTQGVKQLALLGIIAVYSFFLPDFCRAAVRADCSTCHTMHNSQQGDTVAYTLDSSGQKVSNDSAFAMLLKTNCLGCHSYAGAETIVTMEDVQLPVVFNLTEPAYPPNGSASSTLAGGNFHWLATDGDAYGHNVYGIAAADTRFPTNQAPGGLVQTGECVNCHGSLATAQSGCEGCHVPQHHAAAPGTIIDRRMGWYRFLGSVMQRNDAEGPPPEGVVGIEAPDWEQSPNASHHNTYQGKEGPFVSLLESGSIDQKCTGCHQQFHNETTANSTWIRHPVDVAIPDWGEFADVTMYDPLVPVARPHLSNADESFSVITRGSDLVSCISCHRPHGSPYPAMLRWGYRSWPGQDSYTNSPAFNGCAVCHTSKN
jgi:hypothetical protein